MGTLIEDVRYGDQESRTQALASLSRRGIAGAREDVWTAVLDALRDADPLVREWAIVALRTGGDEQRVLDALWASYRGDARDNIRGYAITALGDLGKCLSPDEMRSLYEERRELRGDALLAAAVRGFGKASKSVDALTLLHEFVRNLEMSANDNVDRKLIKVCQAALLRCAQNGIEEGLVSKVDLKDSSWRPLLDRLGELRIQKRLNDEQQRRKQQSMFGSLPSAEEEFTPGSPLSDNERERFVQDLCLWEDLRFATVRLYRRDRALAKQRKKEAGWRCVHCGRAGTAVDSHHVRPRSEQGADIGKNIIVLCPNCHRDTHDKKVEFVVGKNERVSAITREGEVIELPDVGDREAMVAHTNRQLARRIVDDFRLLDGDQQRQVVEDLFAIMTQKDEVQ